MFNDGEFDPVWGRSSPDNARTRGFVGVMWFIIFMAVLPAIAVLLHVRTDWIEVLVRIGYAVFSRN